MGADPRPTGINGPRTFRGTDKEVRKKEREDEGYRKKLGETLLKPVKEAVKLLPSPNQQDTTSIIDTLNKREGEVSSELKNYFLLNPEDFDQFDDFLEKLKQRFDADSQQEAIDLFLDIQALFKDKRTLEKLEDQHQDLDDLEEELSEVINIQGEILDELKNSQNKLLRIGQGFKRLSANDLEGERSGLENWLEGRELTLTGINEGLDFKRYGSGGKEERLPDKVVEGLEEGEGKGFLLQGYAGYSKSTTLKRVMVEMYRKGNIVLYNLDSGHLINNPGAILNTVETILNNDGGEEILIAVDDVHENALTLALPEYLKNNLNTGSFDKVKFLFTARTSEFKGREDILFEKIEDKNLRMKARRWVDFLNKINITKMSKEESQKYFEKYLSLEHSETDDGEISKAAEELVEKVYRESNGHPFILKLHIDQGGLIEHVGEFFTTYLLEGGEEDEEKLKTAFLVCLMDMAKIPITDKSSRPCGLNIQILRRLEGQLVREGAVAWEALHPIWYIAFFSYRLKKQQNNPLGLAYAEQVMVDSFEGIKDPDMLIRMIAGASSCIVGANNWSFLEQEDSFTDNLLPLFEEAIDPPEDLEKKERARLYRFSIGRAYFELEHYDKGIETFKTAIELKNGDFPEALYNRGNAYTERRDEGDLEKAIDDYTKAIDLKNGEYPEALNNRGNVYEKFGVFDEALRDTALSGFQFFGSVAILML